MFSINASEAYPFVPSLKCRFNSFCSIVMAVYRDVGDVVAGSERSHRLSLFRRILKENDEMISRICFGYSRTRVEFEDLRQDTLINIWQGISRFRGDAEMKTWVYRVTLNTCVSTLRRRSKEGVAVPLSEFADLIDETDDHMSRLAALHSAIALLPPVDKAIVLMWLDEMSYEDIASVVGLGRNTVATRLHRAKHKLKNLMI